MAVVPIFSADAATRPAVIAVASGKGGVGKSHISVNLAVGLSRMGNRVLLFDGDLSLGNANILMGVQAQQVLTRAEDAANLADMLFEGPGGVQMIAGQSGSRALADLSRSDGAQMRRAFGPFRTTHDYLLIDTAAGIGPDVTIFAGAADYVAVVLGDEPTAFVDAYALLKTLYADGDCKRFLVITNMVDRAAGERLFGRFEAVTTRFLPVEMHHVGTVPYDPSVRAVAHGRNCIVETYPHSPAGRALSNLAGNIHAMVRRAPLSSDSPFFPKEPFHVRTA